MSEKKCRVQFLLGFMKAAFVVLELFDLIVAFHHAVLLPDRTTIQLKMCQDPHFFNTKTHECRDSISGVRWCSVIDYMVEPRSLFLAAEMCCLELFERGVEFMSYPTPENLVQPFEFSLINIVYNTLTSVGETRMDFTQDINYWSIYYWILYLFSNFKFLSVAEKKWKSSHKALPTHLILIALDLRKHNDEVDYHHE